MPSIPQTVPSGADIEGVLDQLASAEPVQSNCMFQLALMLARIAVEPGAEAYKDETAQAMLGLIRDKPKSNVVRLFGAGAMSDAGGQRRSLSN